MMTTCCPCDRLEHPGKPEIAAGLPALPRQLAGFPEYRLAMLRDIALHAPLSEWRAHEGDDLGIMLLEMWAYMLDILGFYDERIANETYLRTAQRRPSLRRLVEVIGYQPRPALGASVVLAAIAEGNRPVTLPPRTGFRSNAFDDEPPQVFETEFEQTIHSLKNEWPLAPLRNRFPINEILLETGSAAVAVGQLVLLRWPRTRIKDSVDELHAGRVTSLRSLDALDGQSYLRVEMEPPPELNPAVELSAIEVLSPRINASPNLFAAEPVRDSDEASFIADAIYLRSTDLPQPLLKSSGEFKAGELRTTDSTKIRHSDLKFGQTTDIILDAVYPQFAEQAPVIVQRGEEFRARVVDRVCREDVAVAVAEGNDRPTIPATRITLSGALPEGWSSDPNRLVIHFDMAVSGRLTRPAKTYLKVDDFVSPGVQIDGIVEPFPEEVRSSSALLLQDAQDHGALVNGTVNVDPSGAGCVRLDSNTMPFSPDLRTPVTVFGNVVRASRGESVFNEILGSGDAAQQFQSFALANSPLTYLNDPSAVDGRRSTLEVRVNGIRWREVPSFFGVGAEDEVYIVRRDDDEHAIVTFGNGITGARLPTGVDNVIATYRFGAGTAKPPAGAIGQLTRAVEGLSRVFNPVAAAGGADVDQPKDIRRNASASSLILGRAVSTQDFEALAREFGGVVNAVVEWAWDETSQGAVVKTWFITDGGDIAKTLRAFLIGQADPNTPLIAEAAQAQPSTLVVNLEIEPRFNPQDVVEQVKQALINPETGVLGLENIPIGRPLYRSRIFDTVLSVEGTKSVRGMTVDGKPAPFDITVEKGRYRDFLDGLSINTAPGGTS